MCDKTNSSSVQEKLYGKPFAGLFGYSHFSGGFAGGQAEYVRCPFGDVNLLKIPDSVPDEKALFLSDIIPTSYHATVCAEVEKGKSVAIWVLDQSASIVQSGRSWQELVALSSLITLRSALL